VVVQVVKVVVGERTGDPAMKKRMRSTRISSGGGGGRQVCTAC